MKTNFVLLVITILFISCCYTDEERAENQRLYDKFMELSAGSYFYWQEWSNQDAGFYIVNIKKTAEEFTYKLEANKIREHAGQHNDTWIIITNTDDRIISIEKLE